MSLSVSPYQSVKPLRTQNPGNWNLYLEMMNRWIAIAVLFAFFLMVTMTVILFDGSSFNMMEAAVGSLILAVVAIFGHGLQNIFCRPWALGYVLICVLSFSVL